jgi:hypothetical protein
VLLLLSLLSLIYGEDVAVQLDSTTAEKQQQQQQQRHMDRLLSRISIHI